MGKLIAVGGGKGGAGKSVVALGLGTALASLGRDVTLVDLDFGASNMHTLLGHRRTVSGVGPFVYEGLRSFEGLSIPTDIAGLRFIPGTGLVPGTASVKQKDKRRIFSALRRYPSDFVILDLGAGTSRNAIDFFLWSDMGVVVTSPVPSSILNAYEFLKNAVHQELGRRMTSEKFVKSVIERSKTPNSGLSVNTIRQLADCVKDVSRPASEKILSICDAMRLFLVMNHVDGNGARGMAEKLSATAEQFLSVRLELIGEVPRDAEIERMIRDLRPLTLCPHDGVFLGALTGIARRLLESDYRIGGRRKRNRGDSEGRDSIGNEEREDRMLRRSAESVRGFAESVAKDLEGREEGEDADWGKRRVEVEEDKTVLVKE